jgi:hypothetical protein
LELLPMLLIELVVPANSVHCFAVLGVLLQVLLLLQPPHHEPATSMLPSLLRFCLVS